MSDAETIALRSRHAEVAAVVQRLRSEFRWYDALVGSSAYPLTNDVRDLPYVDEVSLERHYYEAPERPGWQVYHTSGTRSGRRKRVLYSPEDHGAYVERRQQTIARRLPRDARVACADLGTGHAAASAIEIFQRLGLDAHAIDCTLPLDDHVETLNRLRPDVLFTMPMILDRLLANPLLSVEPRRVFVLGDVATPAWKAHVRARWKLARHGLIDLVGSIEVGAIAYECDVCGRYHCDDTIIPETLASDGTASASDEAVLVLTSTIRTAFPAVRYVTQDVVKGFGLAPCGSEPRLGFERMLGRAGAEFKHGEKISLYDVTEAVNRVFPGAIFTASDVDGLEIRIIDSSVSPAQAQAVIDQLCALNPWLATFMANGLVGPLRVARGGVGDSPKGLKRSTLTGCGR